MKIKLYVIALSILTFKCGCLGAQTTNKVVKDIPSYLSVVDLAEEREKFLGLDSFVDATKYLPKGFSTQGDVDYTAYIQKALNENRNVLLPNFSILISDIGLDIQSNSTIIFGANSVVQLKPSKKPLYQIIRINNKNNVKIISPKIVGDRSSHIGNQGEWGMGISVVSSNNVYISNVNISNCWGDGIYLGQNNLPNKNVIIKHGVIDNNRRDGISIISSDGLLISDLIISNTNGTNPQAAIDIEPNKPNEPIKDATIQNIYSFNNKNGLSIVLNQQNKTTEPIQLLVKNFKDKYAINGVLFMNLNTQIKGALEGNITLNNIGTDNNTNKFRFYQGSSLGNINFSIRPMKGYSYEELKSKGINILN